ncbi:hypothetical protein RR48_06789 [Papilio machaon]|uniref:Uncharacterized protein n=1 Tax=Papilio machaon TaxID=76193 RepID=A0A194RBL6_PAPMA|nr:hypothetical protein RR48_06789 [Papilio machaon]
MRLVIIGRILVYVSESAESARARRCAAAARLLAAESRALRYLDDVVALLNGNVAAARRAQAWPFALGRREPARNYIV